MLATPLAGKNNDVFRILGISGSGRVRSYNTALLKAAQDVLPDGAVLEAYDVSRFPLFNQDMEAGTPPGVKEFKMKIREADAIIFATPEYSWLWRKRSSMKTLNSQTKGPVRLSGTCSAP